MKKLLTLLTLLAVTGFSSCKKDNPTEDNYREITVNSTPEASKLTPAMIAGAVSLRISGTLNEKDFTILRECTSIQHLDLGNVSIVGEVLLGYKSGTTEKVFQTGNAIPFGAFGKYEIPNEDGTITMIDENTTLRSIVFPRTITTIGISAFHFCQLEGELSLPAKLENIYSLAFRECRKLTGTLTLPASMKFIGARGFSRCGFTGTLVIPDNMTVISDFCFDACTGITKIEFGKNIIGVGPSAFAACTGLKSLTLPESLQTLYYCAFSGCTGLRGDLILPKNVETIDMLAFQSCGFDGTLTLNKALSTIKDYAFDKTNFKEIILPWIENDPEEYELPNWNWVDSREWFPEKFEVRHAGTDALTIPKGQTQFYSVNLVSKEGDPFYRFKEQK